MIKPNEPFELKKSIWTEADFDEMGWHDVHIHALAFQPDSFELYLDIDYMFAWVDPEPPDTHYTFWLAPCTWLFTNVYDFKAEVDWGLGLEIEDVSRELIGKPKNAEYIRREKEWRWVLACQEGELSFTSVGFQQFVRQNPIRVSSQVFSWPQRKGVCFDKTEIEGNR